MYIHVYIYAYIYMHIIISTRSTYQIKKAGLSLFFLCFVNDRTSQNNGFLFNEPLVTKT